MTQHVRVSEVFERIPAAGPLGAPLGIPVSGEPQTWLEEFTSDAERGIHTGFWRCDPGLSEWDFVEMGEVIHVLAGRLVATERGGEPVELGPGDVASFPRGWRGTWEILEPLEKFYVML
ncbi:cupin domain-containing protein [Leucobacter chromiireducens]|uniref:cupin domain-containing protein n=1 Tax=Leucobacter chromiireducens TaxID=283877 RepID=UPI0013DDC1DF|nr:cupin domain-containing protein [Leucobacter chromiireducens]